MVKRGEIWLVNLDPTIGHETKKTRPAVVIQNDIGNKHSPTTIVAPVTSQKTDQIYPIEVHLTTENCGLKKEGKVLLNQISTVDKERLVKKVGTLKADIIPDLDDAIRISLGIE